MLKKHYIGINPHVANSGSRDWSLTGIRGPQVYVENADQWIWVGVKIEHFKCTTLLEKSKLAFTLLLHYNEQYQATFLCHELSVTTWPLSGIGHQISSGVCHTGCWGICQECGGSWSWSSIYLEHLHKIFPSCDQGNSLQFFLTWVFKELIPSNLW